MGSLELGFKLESLLSLLSESLLSLSSELWARLGAREPMFCISSEREGFAGTARDFFGGVSGWDSFLVTDTGEGRTVYNDP